MYISYRAVFIRNLAAAITNSGITLVILLIAPLGLAAVIMNTLLVGGSSFFVCSVMDGIAIWLLKADQPPPLFTQATRQDLSQWQGSQQRSRRQLPHDDQ